MKRCGRFWSLAVLLVAVLECVGAVETVVYFTNGSSIVFRPSISEPITRIVWKFNGDLVAEWVKDKIELSYYGTFRGRTTLDILNGQLEIRGADVRAIGVYSLEINAFIQEKFKPQMIAEVPTPTVWMTPVACDKYRDKCSLSCEGKTEEAEPVTYLWSLGGGAWMDLGRSVTVSNNQTMQKVQNFTCRMQNPVSDSESTPLNNAFFIPPRDVTPMAVGISVLVFVVVVAGVLGFVKRQAIMNKIGEMRGNTRAPQDGGAHYVPSGGGGASSNGPTAKPE